MSSVYTKEETRISVNVEGAAQFAEYIAKRVAEILAPKLSKSSEYEFPPVMTLKDIKAATGYGKNKVLTMMDAGKFPAFFDGGGRGSQLLWRGVDVAKWLKVYKG